jgi:hypothetical protein
MHFRFDRFTQHIALAVVECSPQSGELEMLQSKIVKYEEKLERTTDPAQQTALLTMLAAMRQEMAAMRQGKVLLMQGERVGHWGAF